MTTLHRITVITLSGLLASACNKKPAEQKQPDPPKATGSGSAAGTATAGSAATDSTGSAMGSAAGAGSAVAKEPEAPLPTDGVHVADMKNSDASDAAELTGVYTNAIAFKSPIEIDRLSVYILRDCPAVSCKTVAKGDDADANIKKACPKGYELFLDARFNGVSFEARDPKPGEHHTRVVLRDFAKGSYVFPATDPNQANVPFTISDISETRVNGTIRFKQAGGSAMGTFQATMCPPRT